MPSTTESKTDFERAMRESIATMMATTDSTYNEVISLAATIWVSVMLACYKGDHAKVAAEMQSTVSMVIQGFDKHEFGVSATRLH